MKTNTELKRNGNVEAFRCLLMFFIVAYHCFIYGSCSQSKALWTMCFTVLICWHTDGFLAISGWYGMRFRWSKVFRFVGQMAFYGVLSCLYCWVADVPCPRPWRYFLGGWFGSTYLALMFLALMVNRLFDGRDSNKARLGKWTLGLGLGAYFLTSWITGRFGAGMVPVRSFGLHSVLLMVYVYFIVRLVRQHFEVKVPRKRWLVAGVVLFYLLLPLYRLADIAYRHYTGTGIYGIGAYFAAFDAPHTILAAVSLLLLFVYFVRLPEWICRLAVKISPLLFGVYLCHATTSFGNQFYRMENFFINDVSLPGFVAVVLTAVVVFVTGCLVEVLRRRLVRMVDKIVERLKS